jgi:hypothetical protein
VPSSSSPIFCSLGEGEEKKEGMVLGQGGHPRLTVQRFPRLGKGPRKVLKMADQSFQETCPHGEC